MTAEPSETQILAHVLYALRRHPAVAMVERLNSGMTMKGGRAVRFGFRGCPDIWAMLKRSGRTCWVECKRPGGKLSGAQAEFLEAARQHGAIAFVAYGAEDVMRELAEV